HQLFLGRDEQQLPRAGGAGRGDDAEERGGGVAERRRDVTRPEIIAEEERRYGVAGAVAGERQARQGDDPGFLAVKSKHLDRIGAAREKAGDEKNTRARGAKRRRRLEGLRQRRKRAADQLLELEMVGSQDVRVWQRALPEEFGNSRPHV